MCRSKTPGLDILHPFTFLNLVMLQVNASDLGNSFVCNNGFCMPKDYDPSKPPSYELGGTTIYFNIEMESQTVKKVDDLEMLITFEPRLLMVWTDPRIWVQDQIDGMKYLPDDTLNQIWTPKISVGNCTNPKSVRDPGKYCE